MLIKNIAQRYRYRVFFGGKHLLTLGVPSTQGPPSPLGVGMRIWISPMKVSRQSWVLGLASLTASLTVQQAATGVLSAGETTIAGLQRRASPAMRTGTKCVDGFKPPVLPLDTIARFHTL